MIDHTQPTSNTDPILRLCEYWLSARLMHDHVHELRDTHGGVEGLVDVGLWMEFRTYYSFWLSALYVVAEGFRELRLTDGIIEVLIVDHIDELRLFRNGTFHFQKQYNKQIQFHDGSANCMNWAEELHSEFEEFFLAHIEYLQGSQGHTS